MELSPGEVRGRYAFAAVMIAVGLTPLVFLSVRALRTRIHALAGSSSGPAVHPSAMIETTLLLVAGVVLAIATARETRRGARP
jgi:hypothetical protein